MLEQIKRERIFKKQEEKKSGKVYRKTSFTGDYTILIVSAITFFVMNIIPGGPFNKEKGNECGGTESPGREI